MFPDKQKVREFIASRHAQYEILKGSPSDCKEMTTQGNLNPREKVKSTRNVNMWVNIKYCINTF